MLRRPFCGMAVCFLAGILIAAYLAPRLWCIWLLAVGMCGCGMYLARHISGEVWSIRLRIALCVLLLLAGYYRQQEAQIKREVCLQELSDGARLILQGKVTEKQYQNGQYIYQLTSCYFQSYQKKAMTQKPIACNRVLAYSDSDAASIGEILILHGTVQLWEGAANEGSFDAEAFYLARGIAFGCRDIEIIGKYGNVSRWRETLLALKLQLRKIYQDIMTEDACGVLVTMTLGDKTLLSVRTKQLYQTAGLSHVMAISGLHISVLGMGLYRLLRKRGLGFLAAGAAAGIVIYLYAVMVGMGTSVIRAVGMFGLLLVAQTVGRSYDTLNALGLMALVLLWQNPNLLWDAGFLFSFMAILGVAWVGGSVFFAGVAHEKIKKTIFVSISVQLTTLPLVIWNYYEIPLYALPVNLCILPLMGSVLGFGIAGGLVGLLSVRAAGIPLFFCEKLLTLIQMVCIACEKLPQNMLITGRLTFGWLLCYYVLLLVCTCLAYRGRKSCLAAVLCLLAMLFWQTPQEARADILDVGQGDAIFLRTGGGDTIFVDGGSTNVSKVGIYRILPFLKYNGVKAIDFWLVSHTDEDHISGLREILEAKYPIRQLVFAKGAVQDAAYQKLLTLAEENGTKIMYLTAGDVLHLNTAKIHVLHPQVHTTAAQQQADGLGEASQNVQEADKNGASLVFVYEEGEFSAVFTGDIGSRQEQTLCTALQEAYQSGQLADSSLELYKAAHHGSNASNSKEWLALLRPQISVVSCARNNRYGHPGADAVLHMEEAGSKVYYTMEGGQITLKWDTLGAVFLCRNMCK